MVHLGNTSPTFFAMMCAWWFESFASTAPPLPSNVLLAGMWLFTVCRLPILGDMPWIYSARSIVTYPNASSKNIKPPSFILLEWCLLEM